MATTKRTTTKKRGITKAQKELFLKKIMAARDYAAKLKGKGSDSWYEDMLKESIMHLTKAYSCATDIC